MQLLCDVRDFSIEKDIVRPKCRVSFRISEDREVFAWGQYTHQPNTFGYPYSDYHALCCVAYCDKVPINMEELTESSTNPTPFVPPSERPLKGDIAVAYTIWNCSDTKGSGRSLILALQEHFKQDTRIQRLVTLSPLTEMAKKFHLSNGARLLSTNPESYNFEYEI